jgi:hypothetical protein
MEPDGRFRGATEVRAVFIGKLHDAYLSARA